MLFTLKASRDNDMKEKMKDLLPNGLDKRVLPSQGTAYVTPLVLVHFPHPARHGRRRK